MGKVSNDVWKFFLFQIQPKCFLGFQNSLCHPLLCSWPLFLASPELERWVEVLNHGSEHLLSSQLDLSHLRASIPSATRPDRSEITIAAWTSARRASLAVLCPHTSLGHKVQK